MTELPAPEKRLHSVEQQPEQQDATEASKTELAEEKPAGYDPAYGDIPPDPEYTPIKYQQWVKTVGQPGVSPYPPGWRGGAHAATWEDAKPFRRNYRPPEKDE